MIVMMMKMMIGAFHRDILKIEKLVKQRHRVENSMLTQRDSSIHIHSWNVPHYNVVVTSRQPFVQDNGNITSLKNNVEMTLFCPDWVSSQFTRSGALPKNQTSLASLNFCIYRNCILPSSFPFVFWVDVSGIISISRFSPEIRVAKTTNDFRRKDHFNFNSVRNVRPFQRNSL